MLMKEYTNFFSLRGYGVGQILLTKDGFENETRRQNSKNTIFKLLEMGCIPIINENDSVAIDEIRFGDNDELSCSVAQLVGASILVMLTDIDGLFTANPKHTSEAVLVRTVEKIGDETFALIQDSANSKSRGGMKSKLMAASEASQAGIDVVIANGRRKGILHDIFFGHAIATFIRGKK
jgi:glutamate 5-kinase